MKRKTKIAIRNLYKIFGPDPDNALAALKLSGLNKSDLMKQTGHVLGLEDINIDIEASKITVVMGLSGSGKSTLI
ncbi:MAG: glycine betaine/L-proline ABC transporter ATP-binding protein, partial [Rhodospirillales bacterium]